MPFASQFLGLATLWIFASASVNAEEPLVRLLDGRSRVEVSLDEALETVLPGTAVIVSESHGWKAHHENQKAVLRALAARPVAVSVGMEFFDWTQQEMVNGFLMGVLSEADFLKGVGWTSPAFEFYREQVLFPVENGGWTLGLNAPKTLTKQVTKVGIDGLTREERDQLPPGFQLGNDRYRERFMDFMNRIPHPLPPGYRERMFESQSVWDDVMAYTASEFLRRNPDQILVVIVGDFHAAFGGGLPDRLRARGASVKVFSQIASEFLTPEQLEKELEPDPVAGVRADWIWITP